MNNQSVTIRRSQFIDNGVCGLNQHQEKGSVLEDSLIARNNWRGWSAEHKGWDSVFKWGGMRDGIVRRTQFVDNLGSGFWLDYDNQRITVEQILSARNQGAGVSLELNTYVRHDPRQQGLPEHHRYRGPRDRTASAC